MFCQNCGKENEENFKFCAFCGSSNPESFEFKQPVKPTKQPKQKKPTDWLKAKKLAFRSLLCSLICLIVSFCLTCGSLAYYFIMPPDKLADKPMTPPAAAPVADPTYDTDKITKDPTASPADFGTEATTEQLQAITSNISSVEAAISEGVAEALADEGPITEDNRSEYVYAVVGKLSELYYAGEIEDYDYNNESVTITLNGGIPYVYSPTVDGIDAGTTPVLNVGTYQPCLSGYSSSVSSYLTYPDDAASLISSTFPLYKFDGDLLDYNDAEVSLEALIDTPSHNVVLWHGHGTYTDHYGPVMTTGIPCTDEKISEYYTLLTKKYLLLGSNTFLVTADFFEAYVQDNAYDNTIVYLGTCSSGRGSKLANAFLNKGAEAVYANSGTIHTTYNLTMMKAVADALCSINISDTYNNVSDALTVAKNHHGSYDTGDCSGTYVNLYTNNPSFSLDWYEDHMIAEREVVLVLDASGSMYGQPLNETKKAAKAFVDTVLDSKATVSVVSYSSSANVKTGFTRRVPSLKNAIDNMYDGGGTNTYAGLLKAEELFVNSKAKKKMIILMSDGMPNDGLQGNDLINYANSLRKKGINIYTLGFFQALSTGNKAGAQSLMSAIADPGCYHDVASADLITYVFDDIATEISGERRIYIRVACPVDVEVTYKGETLSKKNPRTSFGSISFELPQNAKNNDSSSTEIDVDAKETIKTVRLKEGLDYNIEIVGTDDGSMDYTIGFMDENGEYSDLREFSDITITDDTKITTKATYSKTSTLNVDEDGDGKTDFVYVAEADSEAEMSKVRLDWRLLVAIISGCLALVSLLVLILSIKLNKKYTAKINESTQASYVAEL